MHPMAAPFRLFLYLYLSSLVSAKLSLHPNISSRSSSPTFFKSRPGCPTKCGHVQIPFPFGVGSKCSMDQSYTLICNTSTPKLRPYLQLMLSQTRFYRVVNISNTNIRIRNPVFTKRCTTRRFTPTNLTLDFSGSPYTLSDANSVTQVGCADLTVLEGSVHYHNSSNVTHNYFAFGCFSMCYNTSVINGSCPGNGCCQIPVPKGTAFINITISGIQNQWTNNIVYNPCSYSFVGEKDSFTYEAVSKLHNYTYTPGRPSLEWTRGRTVVLEWRIGNRSCRDAPKSRRGLVCQENSQCINIRGGIGGYRCKCLAGYRGNPYLPGGCQDVDECKSNPCHVTGICTNTPGGYFCGCPKGYMWRNSSGCLPLMYPKSKLSHASIGLISGFGFTTLLSIFFGSTKFIQKRKNKKRRQKFFKQNGGLLLKKETSVNEGILGNIRVFSARELEKATDRFNESRILGQGGQGTVYKGMLSDGQIVAIKKSQLVDEHKSKHVVEQFINEVALLSQINHRNVVKLLGCCLETKVPLLVYEYVPNGTLYQLIHDHKNNELPFSWNVRLKIAADVAGALAYLHSATSLPIFHRDIKSSNILLDEKYVAKISDFGTSRSLSVDQTHLTTNVLGTFGYIDPEYFQSNQFTEKSDVYSFGVVLVELLTGLKPIISSPEAQDGKESLVLRFLSAVSENKLESIVDDEVWAEGERGSVVVAAKLAQRCLNLNGKERPNMKEVGMELENLRFALKAHTKSTEASSSEKEISKILSTNDASYSWTATFDFPTNDSLSEGFPMLFDEKLRQKKSAE